MGREHRLLPLSSGLAFAGSGLLDLLKQDRLGHLVAQVLWQARRP